MSEPIRVLFLCTHNSARATSQIAEALLRHLGGEDFAAFSAGTEVTRVHPLARAALQEHGIGADSLYSWKETCLANRSGYRHDAAAGDR